MNNFLKQILAPAQLKEQYLNILLNREDLYLQALTSASFDAKNNYEIFELIGDSTANKFLTWYFFRRFPQLNCPQGVKVLARLKINYASKKTFSKIADKLGFWPFIRASAQQKEGERNSLLEDSFEAFIGLTEMLLDEHFKIGVGFAVVNDILTSVFDKMPISLEYEDLYDAKTRLKELFDINNQLGTLIYEAEPNKTTIYRNGEKKIKIGEGFAVTKANQQQAAAAEALKLLKTQGYTRKIEHKLLCE